MSIFAASELDLLADRLAGEYASRFEAHPVAPAARFDDDVLTFSFEQGLGAQELVLRERNRMIELRDHRERMIEPIGAHLVEPVEEFAHSRVAFHVGLFDPAATSTLVLFGFESPLASDGAGRRELLSWSARVRGEARRLRREHVDVRDAHVQIRNEFKAERARLAERFRDDDD